MKVQRRVAVFVCVLFLVTVSADAQKRVFITSVNGPANLSLWTDAGGAEGLVAADTICRARAQAAGLPNIGDFIAWMSDDSDDAYCRLHGLTGNKASNCGQGTLPANAGPWVRLDGFPFAEDVTQALPPTGKVYAPVFLDDLGGGSDQIVFTGTTRDGVRDPSSPTVCGNWGTVSSEIIQIGRSSQTTDHWGAAGWSHCDVQVPLLCVEGGGAGPPLPNFEVYGSPAFVTSVSGSGDLSTWADSGGQDGFDGADAVCAARASDAGFGQSWLFKAWLSDSVTDAKDRFSQTGGWVRLDGVPVADDITDLTDGMLFTSINVTDTGVYLGNYWVWTGTDENGVQSANRCGDWISTVGQGDPGGCNRAGTEWTVVGTSSDCSASSLRLYCLFDGDLWLFADGFETGDLTAWSAWFP